jgi:beta-glucosidase
VRLYVEGIAAGVAAGYGEVVATPEEADLAVLRLEAPYESADRCSRTSSTPARSRSRRNASRMFVRSPARAPTVVEVFLDRPAILTPFAEGAAAVRCPALDGGRRGIGPDVPFDTADPLFRFGHRVQI